MKEANHLTEKILGANGGGLRKQKHVPPLVYVRYLDHVLEKHVDPSAFTNPFIRETIGWLAGENDKAIQVVWERQRTEEVEKLVYMFKRDESGGYYLRLGGHHPD